MLNFQNKIINGDSLKELKKIPDKSFDLIFADPPYNMQIGETLRRPDSSEVKGVNDSSVKWTKERIDESGYLGTRIVFKSDQEESIKALKRAVAIKRQADTTMIESPVRDSKSNGSGERAVRTWAAQVRTLRHHLESRIKVKVPRTSALMTWLVAWSADVINRYKARSSGRTS